MTAKQLTILITLLAGAGNVRLARAMNETLPQLPGIGIMAQRTSGQSQKNMDARLVIAVDNGDIVAVRSLLKQHVNVNATDREGDTVLMGSSDPNITTLLLGHGARVNTRTRDGWTALLIAAGGYYGDDIVPLLVDHGAHVNDPSPNGDTPLTLAAAGFQIHSISTLLSHGAKINRHGHDGRTPLMCATLSLQVWGETQWVEPYNVEAPKTVEYLITRGANVEARDNRGMTALIWASHVVWTGNDADQNAIACQTLSTLLKHHANVDATDLDGNTPLIWCSRIYRYGDREQEDLSVDFAKLLLAHRANPRIRNRYGATALDIARANGFHQLAALLEAAMKHTNR